MAPENRILAGIEYVGLRGISKECKDGVLRLVQYGDQITRARIISNSNRHSLLLTVNGEDIMAVKSGFSSGYLGEGPRTFSYVLQVLDAHGVEIEEYEVSTDVIDRLDKSALRTADLDALEVAEPVSLSQWRGYILDDDSEKQRSGALWHDFPLVIPFAAVDNRITDLAISFWSGPDDRLLTGYRRLEDIIRKRTGINEHGAKLFSAAFGAKDAKLIWKDLGEGERVGRTNLFTVLTWRIGIHVLTENRRIEARVH